MEIQYILHCCLESWLSSIRVIESGNVGPVLIFKSCLKDLGPNQEHNQNSLILKLVSLRRLSTTPEPRAISLLYLCTKPLSPSSDLFMVDTE